MIAKWVLVKKELSDFYLNVIFLNWEVCMERGPFKERRSIPWSPPPTGISKLNVVGASRGKPGLAGLKRVVHNCKGQVILRFSKNVGICYSNETEVLAILECRRFF